MTAHTNKLRQSWRKEEIVGGETKSQSNMSLKTVNLTKCEKVDAKVTLEDRFTTTVVREMFQLNETPLLL